MSERLNCSKCGPIYGCDKCNAIIKGERITAKVVVHRPPAATPEVWGDFCSRTCLLDMIEYAIPDASLAEASRG